MSRLGLEQHEDYTVFRLWAPFARAVSVVGDFSKWQPIAMEADRTTGYWSVRVDGVEPGHAYKYQITGYDGKVKYRNDPRGRVLTDSNDGKSVVYDSSFDWQGYEVVVPQPAEQRVIYEIHIGTFNRPDPSTTGTFASAIERLDYLQDLGVTTLELMPVTSMAESFGWGYAPSAIYSVESQYGGAFGMKTFVKEAHKRGLEVILDVVYNHFSADNDLWQFDGWSENGRGGIYFYNDQRGDTPWGSRPDFGRPEVREFILDNVSMWLSNYHVDGFRVDSTIYMRNTAGNNNDPVHDIPEAWSLLSEITRVSHKIKPGSLVIAEDCAGNSAITASQLAGGAGFDAQWDLGLPHVLRGALHIGGEAPGLANLCNVLGQSFNNCWQQRIVFADSHDTAANGGSRMVAVAVKDVHSINARRIAILTSAIALTAPGVPMLLAGSEFLQGGDFNDWNSLDWANIDQFGGIVSAHRDLIALRRNQYHQTGGLQSPALHILLADENCRVLMYQRGDTGQQPVIVLANFSGLKWHNYQINLPGSTWRVAFNSAWSGYSADFIGEPLKQINSGDKITLAPYQVMLLTQV